MKALLATVCFVWVASSSLFACTILPRPKPAASSFTLYLVGSERSGGIRLSLAGPVKRSERTAADGSIQFTDLPPGIYTLEGPGIFAWDLIEIKKGGPRKVSIDWPQVPVLVSRAVTGILKNGDEPLAPHELILKSTATNRVLGKTSTALDGRFTFPQQPDGTYEIFVQGRSKQDWYEGPILVAVDRRSTVSALEIQVGASSCGLSYSLGCPPTQFSERVATFRGLVTDLKGGVFPGARVILSSKTDPTQVRDLAADSDGQFELKGVPDGNYALRITRNAFAGFATELTIDHRAVSGTLNVRLALLGSCNNSIEFQRSN